MKTPNWKDYKVLSTGDGYKLEKWGEYTLLRPDPQVIWKAEKPLDKYKNIDAKYTRRESKTGEWSFSRKLPESWVISWQNLKFKVQPMNFKHTGLFPEQAVNWQIMIDLIKSAKRPVKVLNLFAYTGGATMACASAGASVVHVDAAKNMVAHAKENARLSGLENAPIRYIVDDCQKFVEKEIRRGNKYDIIIMDPPSFGRGPNNEVWKLEENIFDFVMLTAKLLADNAIAMLINSYTTGLQPTVMQNILSIACRDYNAKYEAYEIGIDTLENNVKLPCGCSALAILGGKNGRV